MFSSLDQPSKSKIPKILSSYRPSVILFSPWSSSLKKKEKNASKLSLVLLVKNQGDDGDIVAPCRQDNT
jgi:hypothetical protein